MVQKFFYVRDDVRDHGNEELPEKYAQERGDSPIYMTLPDLRYYPGKDKDLSKWKLKDFSSA